MPTRAPVIAVCHGGGPMPVLNDPGHASLIKSMTTRVPQLLNLGTPQAPRAIILVTAHWSEAQPTISNAPSHSLYYDYGGFPAESYKLSIRRLGVRGLRTRCLGCSRGRGLSRRWMGLGGGECFSFFYFSLIFFYNRDHGVFIPMLLINPTANIPIIQLSVLRSASPAQHFALGKALSPLRDSGVAIIGSGMPTMHNLRAMFSGQANEGGFRKRNQEWSERLSKTVKIGDVEERGRALEGYREWVGSKEAHPVGGEEHFLPLVVCAGAGGEGEAGAFGDDLMGLKQFSYYWT